MTEKTLKEHVSTVWYYVSFYYYNCTDKIPLIM